MRTLLAGAELGFLDWARYFRRPRRLGNAGSPLDEEGEFLEPDWVIGRADEAAPLD